MLCSVLLLQILNFPKNTKIYSAKITAFTDSSIKLLWMANEIHILLIYLTSLINYTTITF